MAYAINVVIGGLLVTPIVRISNLLVSDILNEQPNSATLTANPEPHAGSTKGPFDAAGFDAGGFATGATPLVINPPRAGQDIKIYEGGFDAASLIFGGTIVTVQQFVDADNPANVGYHLSCTDYTRALNRRKVLKSYATQSATAIVLDLMASRLADGFTTFHVAAGLPAVAIDFTFEEMNRALTRLANRIGGYWYVDYEKDLHFFLEEVADPPADLVPDGDERFTPPTFETDLTQVRTRVLVEGMGSQVLGLVGAGSTSIPIVDPLPFPPTGLCVTGQQRLSYSGVTLGQGGTLVGPGAAPASAPTLASQSGAGVQSGSHGYAVTFVTAAGESIASPIATITVGAIPAPTTPVGSSGLAAGGSVDTGSHDYVVTFQNAAGETTPGPVSGAITTGGSAATPPATAPTVGTAQNLGSVNVGLHKYAVTFVGASGETAPSPVANGTALGPVPAPTLIAASVLAGSGSMNNAYGYQYALSFVTAFGEALPYTAGGFLATGGGGGIVFQSVAASADARVIARRLYRRSFATPTGGALIQDWRLVTQINNNTSGITYTDTQADASLAAGTPPATDTGTQMQTIPLSNIPTGPGSTTARKIYRTVAGGGGALKLLATLANNSTTTYTDTSPDSSLGASAPSGSPTLNTVNLINISLGNASVTGRRIYRRFNGAGNFLLVTTIADNTTTTYTDTTANASLGAVAPATNTAAANQVALSTIPIGNAAVTGRKLYRTTAGGAQLKLLTTIADNTTTTYVDTIADAALGANMPASDTSGLQQPPGQVGVGATSLVVAGTGAFAAGGGWAVLGNGEQVVRYTGVTSTSLTGIPATGPGSITATVSYNTTVSAASALTGVPASGDGAIVTAIGEGQDIHLLVVKDDLAAQAALAGIEGGDGIIEHYVQDRRLSAASCEATAAAELTLFKSMEVRVRYTTRDPKTKSGKIIPINLPPPTNLVGDFLIQRVQLSQFEFRGLPSLRTVEASSTRFSFDDVLRRLELQVYA